jgi:hypothetical protein
MADFTPGPWKVTTNLDYWVETETDEQIAHCGDFSWEDSDEKQYIWEANARLISAAPDLLAAVKCLRQHLALFCTPSDSIAAEIFRLVDATIAKAENE